MIPMLMLAVFLGLILWINRRQMGVKTLNDYATASHSIGVLGITLGFLATWYVGAGYTVFSGFAVSFGMIGMYVIPYGIITMLVMYLVAEKSFIWGKKYNIRTQSELLGLRYRSDTIRVLTGFAGVALSVPWLLMEWYTIGYVFNYATDGFISPLLGMIIGIFVVVFYVALGGMRSVITANIIQGLYMLIAGSAILLWVIYTQLGGIEGAMQRILEQSPEALTFPGPGWDMSPNYWMAIVITSGLGGFMWPWVYNKLFAADSIRTIKQSVLFAPTLGILSFGLLFLLAMALHPLPFAQQNPQEAMFWIHSQAGAWPLGFFAVLVMAASLGTVSSILNAMSTAISGDLAQVIKRDISEKTALQIARWSVVFMSIGALIGAYIREGQLVFLALMTYQGMIVLSPVVLLGLYWKRANKIGAVSGFLAGMAVSFGLTIIDPAFIQTYGWTPGVYGFLTTLTIMLIAGFCRPVESHVEKLWQDIALAKATRPKSKQTQIKSV
ncbi:sodium:solute symporter [Methylophaga sp.]|uniref:sodium:solute symporter family protein n=1 Tax=Methylophaga sp. TaxID=2024840 RepID=UPI00271D05C0|nr:sodium:solute symporter family protein [Methylophaga sp.]MDO8826227.1 sodium:solute symporter family protein [Methylophaga sp.]